MIIKTNIEFIEKNLYKQSHTFYYNNLNFVYVGKSRIDNYNIFLLNGDWNNDVIHYIFSNSHDIFEIPAKIQLQVCKDLNSALDTPLLKLNGFISNYWKNLNICRLTNNKLGIIKYNK